MENMLYSIKKALTLHRVFHGIRFKVKIEIGLSGDNLSFF
jgi:hypothetical protein